MWHVSSTQWDPWAHSNEMGLTHHRHNLTLWDIKKFETNSLKLQV